MPRLVSPHSFRRLISAATSFPQHLFASFPPPKQCRCLFVSAASFPPPPLRFCRRLIFAAAALFPPPLCFRNICLPRFRRQNNAVASTFLQPHFRRRLFVSAAASFTPPIRFHRLCFRRLATFLMPRLVFIAFEQL